MADCNILRRKLVTHGTLNLATGGHTTTRQEWVTEPCGAPLFGAAERERGTCGSCNNGWTHPNNFPCHADGTAIQPASANG